MEYFEALRSNSSPKIRKAAEAIAKQKLTGYCANLVESLYQQIEKPRSWKTQCQLIKALMATECKDALPDLKQLIEREYEHTILYRELGLAIFVLENIDDLNLEFLYSSLEKSNVMQIAGVCSGILKCKIIPPKEDIKRIIEGVAQYTQNEGQIISPRCYIAAVAHLWPIEDTREFLELCKTAQSRTLVEIAEHAILGKESKIKLI